VKTKVEKFEQLFAARFQSHASVLAIHTDRDEVRSAPPSKEMTPQVAVGNEAQKKTVLFNNKHDLEPAGFHPPERCQHVTGAMERQLLYEFVVFDKLLLFVPLPEARSRPNAMYKRSPRRQTFRRHPHESMAPQTIKLVS
jgi:hypothetical protein